MARISRHARKQLQAIAGNSQAVDFQVSQYLLLANQLKSLGPFGNENVRAVLVNQLNQLAVGLGNLAKINPELNAKIQDAFDQARQLLS